MLSSAERILRKESPLLRNKPQIISDMAAKDRSDRSAVCKNGMKKREKVKTCEASAFSFFCKFFAGRRTYHFNMFFGENFK